MSTVADLIEVQGKAIDILSRSYINATKKGGWNTVGALTSRSTLLAYNYTKIKERHDLILFKKKDADASSNNFVKDLITEAEETFIDERGKFYEALHKLGYSAGGTHLAANEDSKFTEALTALTQTISTQRDSASTASRHRKLPPIAPPNFSGKYLEWTSFKDKFTALIAKDDELLDIDHFEYLSSCLSGEAARCIQNIPVIAENYDRAWSRLVSHFDNKRALIASCLDSLFDLAKLTSESSQGLKALRDGTTEAIETLETLGRPVKQWDDILVYMTTRRLDPRTLRDWETSLDYSIQPIAYKTLDSFMEKRIQALKRVEEARSITKDNSSPNKKLVSSVQSLSTKSTRQVHTHTTTKVQLSVCTYCKQTHYISYCESFRNLDLENRQSFVRENNLCFNCLGFHKLIEYRLSKTCNSCHKKHHTLLHKSSNTKSTEMKSSTPVPQRTARTQPLSLQTGESQDQSNAVTTMTTNVSPRQSHPIMLATARVLISKDSTRQIETRTLIDPCSQATFISESLPIRLKACKFSVAIPVSGAGATLSGIAKDEASIIIGSKIKPSLRWKLNALVLPQVTDYQPPVQSRYIDPLFLKGLTLADPQFNLLEPIEIIIGADLYTKIIADGLRKTAVSEIVAQETALGWIITGSPNSRRITQRIPTLNLSSTRTSLTTLIDTNNLSNILRNFWEQEELQEKSSHLTPEESQCEEHFSSTHGRNQKGRYILHLPFNSNVSSLSDSFSAARSMLLHMEKKFKSNLELYRLYQAFMDEYINLGHMKLVAEENLDKEPKAFYLPYHGVLKFVGDKPKLRVVFNGSVRLPVGYNINDCLLPGPKLQTEILDVLLRWRIFRFVFSADIEKMCQQFLIAEEDRKYQRILWRRETSDPIKVYELQTVTYGLVSSPYLAIRSVLQLATDGETRFPDASYLLRKNIYVDDILGGHDDLDGAKRLQDQLIKLLKAGGLRLSKWTANHASLLADVALEDLASTPSRTWQFEEHQMLGLSWKPAQDAFFFHSKVHQTSESISKRKALSLIAQLYDPLGWISPVVIQFKIFMQSLWHAGLQWDDSLPRHLHDRWINLTSGLKDLNLSSIPRWIGQSNKLKHSEFHGFADASERAYAAVLYI